VRRSQAASTRSQDPWSITASTPDEPPPGRGTRSSHTSRESPPPPAQRRAPLSTALDRLPARRSAAGGERGRHGRKLSPSGLNSQSASPPASVGLAFGEIRPYRLVRNPRRRVRRIDLDQRTKRRRRVSAGQLVAELLAGAGSRSSPGLGAAHSSG